MDFGSVGSLQARQPDVIYGRKYGLALTMEVLTPRERTGCGVVWVVSSSGMSSRDQTFLSSFERRVSPLLEHGYTVFAVIHGSSPRFQVQDHVQDARRAVQFIRYHAPDYGIDGQHLAIAGSSSGGYIALMVALNGQDGDQDSEDVVGRVSSRVQAAGCFFPPTDLLDFDGPSESIVDFLLRRYGVEFFNVDATTGVRTRIEECSDVLRMLREMSPITHVTADDPPTILIHGDEDTVVPLEQSRRLVERLQNLGVPARLVVREARGHAWPGWESDSVLIAQWFDAHLRGVQ